MVILVLLLHVALLNLFALLHSVMSIRPIYYQVSPAPNSVELRNRIDTFLYEHFAPVIAENLGIYRGLNIAEFNDDLRDFVTKHEKDDVAIPFVLAFSGHGLKVLPDNKFDPSLHGALVDYLPIEKKMTLWTAPRLWDNYMCVFTGLKKLLKPFIDRKRKIYIVFAQCYGGYFSKFLLAMWVQKSSDTTTSM